MEVRRSKSEYFARPNRVFMPTESTLERPLPSNLDAERSILGAILVDNHALNAAIESVKVEDFFLSQNRQIFQRMIALGEAQQPIDLVTLTDELHRRGELEAVGGSAYIASLADGVPRVSNVEHYARIVKEKAILRNLIHTTHNIQQKAFEGEDGADTILDSAESKTASKPAYFPSRTSFTTTSIAWRKSSGKGRASPAFRLGTANSTSCYRACSRRN
jgi:replicative DNA helicase